MTCPVCGTPTVAGARFCFACGAALVGTVAGDEQTERRIVTVLFGDLSDFTSWSEDLDPEQVGVVTDRVLASLAAIVGEFGGHVDKLTGDGIMAVFGAPTAHEDDAERAVRAAARMQAVVRRLVEQESGGGQRLGLRVGLNTGEVLAGVQAHLSYTVIGDAVNTAARLSDAAGVGAVFAGRDTALTTLTTASWRALAPLRLKGKRDLVPAYELVGLRPASASRLGLGDEAPFLGREAEFGQLVGRLLDIADRTTSRTVMLSGDAGVGKSRLAQELSRFAGELPGARVLWGRCAPYGEGRDLAAVAEMVRTACGIGEGDDVDTARERVVRAVGRLEHLASPGPGPEAVAERLTALLGL
ncbi:MAG: adenylate/guanylate cyclase, partial [Frankiales bacterium]|nr:adenylate/guanylate cyclase [Frankiales bacterium]